MSDPENGDIIENPAPEADTEGEVETDNPEGQYGVSSENDGERGDHVTEQDSGSGDAEVCAGNSANVCAITNNDEQELPVNNYVTEEPEGDCFGAVVQNSNCDCAEADSELGTEIITEGNLRTSSESESQRALTEDDIEADLLPRTNQDLMDRANCVPESEKDLQSVVAVDTSILNKIKPGEQDLNETSQSLNQDFTNNSLHGNQSASFKTQGDPSPLCTPSVGASNVDLLGLPEDEGLVTGTGDLPEDARVKDILEDTGLKDLPEDAGRGDLPEDESIFLNSSDNEIVNGSAYNAKDIDTTPSVTVNEAVSIDTGDQAASALSVDDVKVPEDEIGSVGIVLSNGRLCVLSPAESVESYEPECDQETECSTEINTFSNNVGDLETVGNIGLELHGESNSELPMESASYSATHGESNSEMAVESNSETCVESNSCSSNSEASIESSSVTTTSVEFSGNSDGNMPNKTSGSNNHQGQGCDGLDEKMLTQGFKSTNGSSVEVNSSQVKVKLVQNCDNDQENLDNVVLSESVSSNRSDFKCETPELQNSLFQISSDSAISAMPNTKTSKENLKSVADQESNKLDDDLLSELESELGPSSEEVTLTRYSGGNVNNSQFDNIGTINGVAVDAKIVQQCKELQEQLKIMKEQLQQQAADNER